MSPVSQPKMFAEIPEGSRILQASHISALVESKGLIERRRSALDGRVVLLRLTSTGEKLLRKLSASHHEELQTAGPRLLGALKKVAGARKT